MPPESPELDFPQLAGMPPELAAVVAPVLMAAAQVEVELAEARQQLAREAAKPDDPEIVDALQRASEQPDAPASLQRVARRISLGQLSWHDVLSGSPDPDVADLRRDEAATAKAHSDELQLLPAEKPAAKDAST